MGRPPSDQPPAALAESWAVPPGQEPIRLDAFARRCLPHLSLQEVRRAIDEGAFWINGRPGRKGDRLFGGDILALRGSQRWLQPSPSPEPDFEIPILYEDEHVLVVDKPAGIATHGFSGREKNSLANFLLAIQPALRDVGKSPWEPGLLHRLDRGTSGIVLVAKDQLSFEKLRFQFGRGLVEKKYWALVWGRPKAEGHITYPLIHDPKDRAKMKAVITEKKDRHLAQAKRWRASTRFRILGYADEFSLLQVAIETGVTHQIRVHLQALGYPLVGDPLYGKERPDPFSLGRQFLHAFYLRFRHPQSGAELAVESPLPGELKGIVDRLGINL